MKQLTSIAACAFCLAVVALPGAAQDFDNAKISQGGSGNAATVEQFASGGSNYVVVRQGDNGYGGSNNQAKVLQQGVHGSDVFISQSGSYNDHTVSQYDGLYLQASVNLNSEYYGGGGGEGNTVVIEQSGYAANALVEQGGSMYSRADIMQSGWEGGNMAEILQHGEANQASVFQSGSNQAMIYQAGNNLNASIMQNSNNSGNSYGYGYGYGGNTATIRQSH